MKLGIPKETVAGESRVATTPDIVKKLAAAGIEVLLERGAGDASHFVDDAFVEAGATLTDRATALGADIVAKVRKPDAESNEMLSDDERRFVAPTSMRDVEPSVHVWRRFKLGGKS